METIENPPRSPRNGAWRSMGWSPISHILSTSNIIRTFKWCGTTDYPFSCRKWDGRFRGAPWQKCCNGGWGRGMTWSNTGGEGNYSPFAWATRHNRRLYHGRIHCLMYDYRLCRPPWMRTRAIWWLFRDQETILTTGCLVTSGTNNRRGIHPVQDGCLKCGFMSNDCTYARSIIEQTCMAVNGTLTGKSLIFRNSGTACRTLRILL